MIFTCAKTPDRDGRFIVKLDGRRVGQVFQKTMSGNTTTWTWETFAIDVVENMKGSCDSKEEALEELKASDPVLIEH